MKWYTSRAISCYYKGFVFQLVEFGSEKLTSTLKRKSFEMERLNLSSRNDDYILETRVYKNDNDFHALRKTECKV